MIRAKSVAVSLRGWWGRGEIWRGGQCHSPIAPEGGGGAGLAGTLRLRTDQRPGTRDQGIADTLISRPFPPRSGWSRPRNAAVVSLRYQRRRRGSPVRSRVFGGWPSPADRIIAPISAIVSAARRPIQTSDARANDRLERLPCRCKCGRAYSRNAFFHHVAGMVTHMPTLSASARRADPPAAPRARWSAR